MSDAERLCANCGATLTGPFCSVCGQSEDDIRRPIWSLVQDVLGRVLDWDGKFLFTLRRLYTRPGRVARDYVDGKRASYTPPIRLYVLISLAFFLFVAALDIRVVALEYTIGPDAPPGEGFGNLIISGFRSGEPPPPYPLSDEFRARLLEQMATDGDLLTRAIGPAFVTALDDPAGFEVAASRGAARALLAIIAVFVLMNMVLHPKRRLIEHIVYSLYLHASFLPVQALMIVSTILLGWNETLGEWALVITLAPLIFGFAVQDRGFYGSSWLGLLWRIPLLTSGYVFAIGALWVVLGLLVLL